MWLKVMDSKAYFATRLIHVEVTDAIRENIHSQVEQNGIVCYSLEELDKVTALLDSLQAGYTVEELMIDPVLVAKTQDVAYLTPEEVKKHLLEDVEPESMVVPTLRKKLAEKDAEIKSMQTDFEKLKMVVNGLRLKLEA